MVLSIFAFLASSALAYLEGRPGLPVFLGNARLISSALIPSWSVILLLTTSFPLSFKSALTAGLLNPSIGVALSKISAKPSLREGAGMSSIVIFIFSCFSFFVSFFALTALGGLTYWALHCGLDNAHAYEILFFVAKSLTWSVQAFPAPDNGIIIYYSIDNNKYLNRII